VRTLDPYDLVGYGITEEELPSTLELYNAVAAQGRDRGLSILEIRDLLLKAIDARNRAAHAAGTPAPPLPLLLRVFSRSNIALLVLAALIRLRGCDVTFFEQNVTNTIIQASPPAVAKFDEDQKHELIRRTIQEFIDAGVVIKPSEPPAASPEAAPPEGTEQP